MNPQNRRLLLYMDQSATHPPDTSYLENAKVVFSPRVH